MASELLGLQFIGPDEVEKCLEDYLPLVDAIEKGLGNFSRGKTGDVDQPVRSVVSTANGFLGCMPVYSKSDELLVTKIVSFFPKNVGVPSHHALILISDPENGVPLVLMDGEIITARRTAAASAVASKHLADPNSKVLAILGTGVQAKSHFHCLSSLFSFQEIRFWNHRPDRIETFLETMPKNGKFIPCSDVKTAVENADIIVTVTSSAKPIVKAEWIKKGAHINAVGACRPDWAELEADLVRSSVVYVDSYEGAYKESGDIILAKANVFAEIGEVINGIKAARGSETTIFKSLGMAIEDGVAAKLVMNKLKSQQDDFGVQKT